jgi:hypothetical protein
MYFLVSVSNEVFHRVMSMRALHRQLGIDTSVTRDAPELLRRVRRTFGGRLVLLDWSLGKILADIRIPGVSGIAVKNGVVLACSWIDQCIYVLQEGRIVATVTHPWFNYLHSIELTERGTYLVASAGSDLVAEINVDGDLLWEWFGPEHGYDTLAEGTPALFDRTMDYRRMRRSTSEQAMHVTSAIHFSPDTVLAALFHQGQVVAISKSTGQVSVRLEGLRKPHGIHVREEGFVVTDTLGHRILLLDSTFGVCSEIAFGSQWLQDTIVASTGTYLVLENVHIDQLPEPGLMNRIVEIDGCGEPLRCLQLAPDYRLFNACEVDAGCAKMLAGLWGSTGDLVDWRWE